MRLYSNIAAFTSLTAAVSNTDTTIPVGDTAGWPNPGAGDVGVGALDHSDQSKVEVFSYTGKTSVSFTGVTRGLDGTTAQSHASGARVRHIASAVDIQTGANATPPDLSAYARKDTAQTFSEDQTIEDLNQILLGDRGGGPLRDGNGNIALGGYNYRYNAGDDTWRRRFLDNDASRWMALSNGDIQFATNSDALDAVDSVITWLERGRLTRAGVWKTPMIGARVYRATTQSVPSGTETLIDFTAERSDEGGFHDNAVNPSRLIVPAGMGGWYRVWAVGPGIIGNGVGFQSLLIKNGAGDIVAHARTFNANGPRHYLACAGEIYADAGDYFTCRVHQTSGAAQDVDYLQGGITLGCSRIGGP